MSGSGSFAPLEDRLPAIRDMLAALGFDGWLLYDLHQRNPVAARLLGVGDLSRRYFVLLPVAGEPRALTHAIEEAPWAAWPWKRSRYSGWAELRGGLGSLLEGRARVAMEVSPQDAVPPLDLVPAGVVELIRALGVEVLSSGDLVTRFHSVWSGTDLDSHRRAAGVLADTAAAAFDRLAQQVAAGETVTEGGLRRWVLDRLAAAGCGVGADAIVAGGARTANPHYHPGDVGAILDAGQAVLLDLWGKEQRDAIYADQTWMAYLGARVPESIAHPWSVVRDARDAAVRFIGERWAAGGSVHGHEVDDVAREVVRGGGFGDFFIHRTGHSIDREVHGMGPNLDNYETQELRRLMPGVGFSVEPGVYIPGRLGLRSEINVYLAERGPEVTTPTPQTEIRCLLPERGG